MQQGNKFINLTGEFGLEKILIHLSKSIVSLSSGVVTNYALQIFLTKKNWFLFIYFNFSGALNINEGAANKEKKYYFGFFFY